MYQAGFNENSSLVSPNTCSCKLFHNHDRSHWRSQLAPWCSQIDRLPNYGPSTSKRYRKPVTTGNTVISNCEKRNFRRSSDLAEAKIYLFACLVIFDMPSTDHFFRSLCSQVGMTMVLVGEFEVFVFGRLELLYRDFDKVSDSLDLSKAGWTF